MAASTSFPRAFAASDAQSRTQSIPWYIWLAALGVASSMIGVQWDISWHESIGRDTFWTPAHLAIQLCGVIARHHLRLSDPRYHVYQVGLRAGSVNVLGFRVCRWAPSSAPGAVSP